MGASIAQLVTEAALLVWAYMTGWFVISLVMGRNDIADTAWGLGFVVIGWFLVLSGDPGPRQWIATALVTAWGLRLAIHVWTRNARAGEDYRYAAWRRDWGRWFYLRSYLQVFILQGVFMVLISAPLVFIAADPGTVVGALGWAGTMVWMVGFAFEAVADLQLRRFKSDPANRGHVMRSGLWRYSRHPNYFGEIMCWWGLWLLALDSGYGWISIVGPLTITVLLLKVSGVPMLERKHAGEAEFESYRRATSVLVPLPPRDEL